MFYFFLFYFPSVTIYQALVSRINPSNSLATTTTTTPAPVAKISGKILKLIAQQFPVLHLWTLKLYNIIADGCAVYLNSSSAGGTIQSVNYPSDYDPNLDCTYTFEAPTSDYTVQLTFTDFSVESCCDSFSVSYTILFLRVCFHI